MKPINLKIKGINSYVTEQEVCFDKLSQTNLFGIFGETGSGKTTILDSIVIALYGSSDRETIPNIINVNSKDAHIYFTFECEQAGVKKTFTVKREYKVRQSGVKSDAILLETKTDKVLAEQTDMVNDYILKLIGVAKKEFLKCIALPQGEFDRFLMDTPANRKKTIEKLFGLEEFGANLQEKLKRKRDIVTLSKLSIQEKIDMMGKVDEEGVKKVKESLKSNQKDLKDNEALLKIHKEQYEKLVKDLEFSKEYVAKETEYSLLKSELNSIKTMKKQVEFTEKYGEYSQKNNKLKNIEQEISVTTLELKDDKELLLNATNELERVDEELVEKNGELKAKRSELKEVEEGVERRSACLAKKETLEKQKTLKDEEIADLMEEIRDLKETLADYKKIIDENEKTQKNLQSNIDDNNDILEKLRDLKNVKTVEGFLDYLHYAQNIVSPDSLAEVYQYDVHKEIKELLSSLSDYEKKTRTQIIELQEDYKTLSRYSKDFEKLQNDLIETNGKLIEQNEALKAQLEKIKLNKAICENQITSKQFTLQEAKEEARTQRKEIESLTEEIKKYKGQKELDTLRLDVEELSDLISHLNQRKIELNDEKNKSVVSIEVAMTVLENYKKQQKEVEAEIKKLGVKVNETNVFDKNLYLDDEKLEETKKYIEEFENRAEWLEGRLKDLKGILKGKIITEEKVEQEKDLIASIETKIRANSVNIALAEQAGKQYEVALVKINELKQEKQKIQNKLDTVSELLALTANGKLLDFVAEEYMLLITQFSNKFVYNISKGKYMLKYSGEFYVVDNFNGGISRSVKTLSGGERFIISLSLALGISQSIAINNNKKFNFFFIDEGFGSLSENYIENVLGSFDALIRLGFTVGFISHVEKMQGFINNRIVVNKSSNEEGSIIKQYY